MTTKGTPKDGGSMPEAEFTVDDGAAKLLGLLPDDDDDVTSESEDKKESKKKSDDDADDDDQQDDDGDDDEDEEDDDDTDDKGDDDADADDDDGDDDGDDEGDDDEPQMVTVVVDGKPEVVTLEEALKGYSRTSDYTRKTQALAADRKTAAAEAAAVREARGQYAARLEKLDEHLKGLVPAEPDWEKIRRETPEQFASIHAEWTVYTDRQKKVADERKRVAAETQRDEEKQVAEYLTEQQSLLHVALPDLADPAKRGEFKKRLVEHAVSLGYTKEEVEAAGDHRALVLLSHSMQLADIQAKATKAQVQAKKKKVPNLKPGDRKPKRTKGQRKAKAARARLRESGSVDDAASALLDMD